MNPERTASPMRTKAFGVELEGSLLTSEQVAEVSLTVITTLVTGQVVNVRR